MFNRLPSARRLRRLNRRQRKRLHVGEFQELVFKVGVQFREPMHDAAHDAFVDGFIEFIESRRLAVGGLGGKLPLMDTDGVVLAWGRGSPDEADRVAVVDWLQQRPEVARAEAGRLVDGWYGWEDAQ